MKFCESLDLLKPADYKETLLSKWNVKDLIMVVRTVTLYTLVHQRSLTNLLTNS